MRSTANRFARTTLVVCALSLGFGLSGCGTFDPTDVFNFDFLDTKKKLAGDRKAVFPEGTPGVPQGVPAELMKGYQAPEQPPEQTASVPEPEKPKPKPKPKVVAKPEQKPTAVTVRPGTANASASATQWPEPPQQRTQQAGAGAGPWPDPPQEQAQPRAQQGGGAWPGSSQSRGGTQWPDPPQAR